MKSFKKIAFKICFLFALPVGAETHQNTPETAVKILLNEIKQIVEGDSLSEVEKAANQKHSNIALGILKVPEISRKAVGYYW